jgi:hypothetical protein
VLERAEDAGAGVLLQKLRWESGLVGVSVRCVGADEV